MPTDDKWSAAVRSVFAPPISAEGTVRPPTHAPYHAEFSELEALALVQHHQHRLKEITGDQGSPGLLAPFNQALKKARESKDIAAEHNLLNQKSPLLEEVVERRMAVIKAHAFSFLNAPAHTRLTEPDLAHAQQLGASRQTLKSHEATRAQTSTRFSKATQQND